MNIFKLHFNLIKYIILELRKKKTTKEHIEFLKAISKEYGKVIKNEFKNLWNFLKPEYRKQRKKFKNYEKLRKELNNALKLLRYIDSNMKKMGLNRQSRRNFWKEFYKMGDIRKEIFDKLEKDLNSINKS